MLALCTALSGLSFETEKLYLCRLITVPSRDRHHDICDLRCFAAGNIANGSLNTNAMPLLGHLSFFCSATGQLHTIAEHHPMKLFLPNRCRLGVLDWLGKCFFMSLMSDWIYPSIFCKNRKIPFTKIIQVCSSLFKFVHLDTDWHGLQVFIAAEITVYPYDRKIVS